MRTGDLLVIKYDESIVYIDASKIECIGVHTVNEKEYELSISTSQNNYFNFTEDSAPMVEGLIENWTKGKRGSDKDKTYFLDFTEVQGG